MWGNSSWLPPLGHGVLPASAPDLGVIDKSLARLIKKERESTEINKIRSEKQEATSDSTEIKGL